MDRDPFLAALRTLGRIGLGLQPVPTDVDTLKLGVFPQEAELPVKHLCQVIIQRELDAAGNPVNRTIAQWAQKWAQEIRESESDTHP